MGQRFFLLVVICLWSTAQLLGRSAENGLLDLRDVDLFGAEVRLDGSWEFYWETLERSWDSLPAEVDYYPFPALWNKGHTVKNVALTKRGYATYALRLLLPSKRPKLGILVKHFYTSFELAANGQLIGSGGTVGESKELSEPSWVPDVIQIAETGDTLDLILNISNHRHGKGGAREPLILGDREHLESGFRMTLAFDLLLTGTLVMAGLFFYGLYAFGLRDKAVIFFALFCLTFSYRIVGADDYSLQIIYPQMNWLLGVKLEYLSLFVPPIFFALYSHALFPFKYRFKVVHLFVFISGLFAVITIIFPPSVFTVLVEPYLVVLLFAIVLGVYVYIRAYQEDLDGAKYALISSGIVMAVFLCKILDYLGVMEEIEFLVFLGYLSFFFFQSTILFFIFTNSLKKSKEQAEFASKSKSDFLSMMSHEIRTPMNAVIGLSNFLLEDNPRKSQLSTLNTLKFSAQNLLVIINDILDFSKIEADKIEFNYESVNIRELFSSLERVFRPLAAEKSIKLTFDVDARIPPFIICDQTRTSQVLTNLISNALKFTDEGSVTVRFALVERQVDSISILTEVKDTGIGIPRSKQSFIFQSFTQANSTITRKFGGTGLGLSITKKLLELQGSKLELESDSGAGATFSFVQKFQIGNEPEGYVDSSVEPVKQRVDFDILLVEDNEINVMVARNFLDKWGAKVTVANNGKEALDLVRRKVFKVILMDLQMPVMDGYEAVREMRKSGVTIPVIALTASALFEDQKKIYEAGMDDFVTKPFSPEVLLEKIIRFARR